MKFIAKCIAVFIILTFVFILAESLFFSSGIPLSAKFLFSSTASLILTIFYGWVDAVFVQQRQPEI